MSGDRATALNFYQKAVEAQSDQNAGPDLRYQLLSSAVMADPSMGMGFYELGNINGSNFWRDAAVSCYRRALELPNGTQPGDMTPEWRAKAMNNIAFELHHLGRQDEAREWGLKAIKAEPNLSKAWLTLSLIDNIEGNLHRSIAYARKALALEKDPAIELGLAFALMHDGQYAEGLKHFQARVEYVLRHFLSYPYPRWDGERDKTVFLVADQGIGDTLSFARFVPAVLGRCKRVHMRIQPELLRLFRIFFQRYDNLTIEPLPCPFPPADGWTSFMCLPTALGLNDEEIRTMPGLQCPQIDIGRSWLAPDRDMHIGVAWKGSEANMSNNWRSFPMELLLDLYQVPGIQLYSLQIGQGGQDIHTKGSAALIYDLNPYVRDVSDTIGILRELDLVISCESLLPHICGLTGTECWIAYSHNAGDFRIGRTEERGQLWNPHARIFKQGRNGKWGPVFQRIKEALRDRMETRLLKQCG